VDTNTKIEFFSAKKFPLYLFWRKPKHTNV